MAISAAEAHIEEIRRRKFFIGSGIGSIEALEDLHHAVGYLSAELYTKDVHFLMELIQNAEDNEYLEGVNPSLEFVITSRDVTGTGAETTLLIFNNERGFSHRNIESICSLGRSTKKGNRKRGYIGEKGIGFKSVFLITSQPYIFSNGYQIRFNEAPCSECNVGYIVPEWIDEDQILSNIKKVYGSNTTLPTTTLVLPLKPDKVKPVKQQLSSIHPEVLLFLSKIKHLSVREVNENPMPNTVSEISISGETDAVARKDHDAESYILHLSAEETGGVDGECPYYMWKQKFPVREENKVENRMGVEDWIITLAFPFESRLNRGMSSPGIYAFLPTEMVTNFPFIIQADFVLASSRESILIDNKWNQGILNCIPTAFVNAFISLVKNTDEAPVFNLPPMFRFLPIVRSSYEKMNAVRESIKEKLLEEDIVPCESYSKQKFFHKPCKVGRLMPDFWIILEEAWKQRVSLIKLSSHGRFILSSSFDKPEYDQILHFLGVEQVSNEWYAKCLVSCNLVAGVSDDVYLSLLFFIAEYWRSKFHSTDMKNIALIRHVGVDGSLYLSSISELIQLNAEKVVQLSDNPRYLSWLMEWNKEFSHVTNCFFMPESTQKAILSCSKKEMLLEWLREQVKVHAVNVQYFAVFLLRGLGSEKKMIITFVHFLYHSLQKKYITEQEVRNLCATMPLVDTYGYATKDRRGVLVPADRSKWAVLLDSNLWRAEGYIELAEDYLHEGHFAREYTARNQLIDFLGSYVGASDIPYLSPPNSRIETVFSPLTKENVFLLLDWMQEIRTRGLNIPENFLRCIKEGGWLRITVNKSSGYRPPSQSFQLTSSCGTLLQNGSVFVDIPLIDERFYGERINRYKDVLKSLGVMTEYREACQYIGKHLMDQANSSTLTRENVASMLKFIRFLRESYLSPVEFITSVQRGSWLKTSRGYRSPIGSVLYDQDWRTASQISDIPFIDKDYYGEVIHSFAPELALLGVIVSFKKNYQLVVDYFKIHSSLTSMKAESIFLSLQCIRSAESSSRVVEALRNVKCLKTNMGFNFPSDCYLLDPEWGCILQVFTGFPLIDNDFYGRTILSYRNELMKLGVVVDFQSAVKKFIEVFEQKATKKSITKDNVFSFLTCYRKLEGESYKFPTAFEKCIQDQSWLKTRLGDFRSPKECILFGSGWESISPITLLPFIDDSDYQYGKGISEYKKELKSMGVITDFKDGTEMVCCCLYFPSNPSSMTSANVLALLDCIRISLEKNYSFPEKFLQTISRPWLLTQFGYRSPKNCLLFNSKWSSHLKQTDGPFLHEPFYTFNIKSYQNELNAIGMASEVERGCQLVASCLAYHVEFSTIVRIYKYLSAFLWKPESEGSGRIWIPAGDRNGWVDPKMCVLRDKNKLFGSQLTVLQKHYEPNLLFFFNSAFDVKTEPSIEDYCKLWKSWESSNNKVLLSQEDCFKFWKFVTTDFNSESEKIFYELVKVPAINSGSDGVLLINKRDVFIPDDLLLKDLFEEFSPRPVFVWYPQSDSPSFRRTKLLEIYGKIGVQTISKAVYKDEGLALIEDEVKELKEVTPKDVFIGKVLIKLILGFLANPGLKFEAARRHETVRGLLKLIAYETEQPIMINYSLSLSSGEIIKASGKKMIRWDREGSKFFTQKMDRSRGGRDIIEHATNFSQVISEGVLWENSDYISSLSELVKLGFLLEFNEDAVEFLMKSKNLQVLKEDEEFLLSAFG